MLLEHVLVKTVSTESPDSCEEEEEEPDEETLMPERREVREGEGERERESDRKGATEGERGRCEFLLHLLLCMKASAQFLAGPSKAGRLRVGLGGFSKILLI